MDDMEDEAEALLARIMMIRDDLNAGRLAPDQVARYRELGRRVARITADMDAAADIDAAYALWRKGADMIDAFLAEHFPQPTRH
ncbi:hypothetical protein [Caulobacter sp.]|uniref:hypothetical protein n=1 Tax=Caulobacter sp. TaxID=78 RepID=UPI001B2F7F42|nr:hypothetical protein [Caulobacter sp.]MBO9545820.1 hypothetical protein [Caulobacter sp.]